MNSLEHRSAVARAQQPSAVSRVRACLDVIEDRNEELRALITVDASSALREAARLDRDRAAGVPLGDIAGLIMVLKDNIDTAGLRTTVGSSIYAERVPTQDAFVTERLRAAHALILGKANLHEFAFGATSENPHYGSVRNPWDTERVPGGSSGGSGAAVAAGMCDASLGTDTGGSVRVPAALTGLVGLRPTPGRISNRGSAPSSPRFDTIGPLARSARTVTLLYEAVAGFDSESPDSAEQPVERLADLTRSPLRAAQIGLPDNDFFDRADPEINGCVHSAVRVLENLGAHSRGLAIEGARATHDAMACVVRADAAEVHRQLLDHQPEGFGSDVLARFRLGLQTSKDDYGAGIERWRTWQHHVSQLFEDVDFILTPTVGFIAPLIKSTETMHGRTHELTAMTFVWSFAGSPAISIPCGFSREGLPIAMQLIGRPWSEASLLGAAIEYQDVTSHHLRDPYGAGGVVRSSFS